MRGRLDDAVKEPSDKDGERHEGQGNEEIAGLVAEGVSVKEAAEFEEGKVNKVEGEGYVSDPCEGGRGELDKAWVILVCFSADDEQEYDDVKGAPEEVLHGGGNVFHACPESHCEKDRAADVVSRAGTGPIFFSVSVGEPSACQPKEPE